MKTCERCGKGLIPAPARFEGKETTCGFHPCVCSRTAWLNCSCREYGSTLEEHRAFCCGEGWLYPTPIPPPAAAGDVEQE